METNVYNDMEKFRRIIKYNPLAEKQVIEIF